MVETARSRIGGIDAGTWLTGAAAGAVGAAVASVMLYASGAFDPAAVGIGAVGVLFMPGAVFGLIYAGLARLDRLSALAREPETGVLLGLGYGFLFWVTTVVGSEFAPSGLLAGLTFGVVIGFLFAVSPYVE